MNAARQAGILTMDGAALQNVIYVQASHRQPWYPAVGSCGVGEESSIIKLARGGEGFADSIRFAVDIAAARDLLATAGGWAGNPQLDVSYRRAGSPYREGGLPSFSKAARPTSTRDQSERRNRVETQDSRNHRGSTHSARRGGGCEG